MAVTQRAHRKHPGDLWRQVMEENGLTQVQVAEHMGISPKHLNLIVNGHRLPNARLTVAFSRATGYSATDLWQAVADYVLDEALH